MFKKIYQNIKLFKKKKKISLEDINKKSIEKKKNREEKNKNSNTPDDIYPLW